jgi:uncharacterized protein (DUF433 family)
MKGIEPPTSDARRLLGIIVGAIKEGRILEGRPETFLAYSEVLELLGEHDPRSRSGVRLSQLGLKELHFWLEEHDELPKVTGLIVNKSNRRPHEKFAEWHGHGNDPDWEAWWMHEANRAIRFDWSPFVGTGVSYHRGEMPIAGRVREEVEPSQVDYRGIIEMDPAPAHIRQSRITVGDILRWLAAGTPESEILRQHPELRGTDIRASLAYAAEREQREAKAAPSRLSTVASTWQGRFTLPASDDSDPRMDYLLKKYWKNRK